MKKIICILLLSYATATVSQNVVFTDSIIKNNQVVQIYISVNGKWLRLKKIKVHRNTNKPWKQSRLIIMSCADTQTIIPTNEKKYWSNKSIEIISRNWFYFDKHTNNRLFVMHESGEIPVNKTYLEFYFQDKSKKEYIYKTKIF